MKKDLFAIVIVIFIVVFICKGTNIQSVEEYYLMHLDDIQEDSETVFLSIRCDTILDNWDKLDPELKYEKYVPSNGEILARSEYVLRKGDAVYDILNRAVRHNKIQMECIYTANYASIYVEGINHLYEFSCGELSGWMYMVNGSFPNIPFCDYVPQDGDVMRVQFTLSYGADIGDWGIMGEPFFEPVERETLTKLIATALEKGIDVTSAMEIVSTFGVTQKELDAAAEELSKLING